MGWFKLQGGGQVLIQPCGGDFLVALNQAVIHDSLNLLVPFVDRANVILLGKRVFDLDFAGIGMIIQLAHQRGKRIALPVARGNPFEFLFAEQMSEAAVFALLNRFAERAIGFNLRVGERGEQLGLDHAFAIRPFAGGNRFAVIRDDRLLRAGIATAIDRRGGITSGLQLVEHAAGAFLGILAAHFRLRANHADQPVADSFKRNFSCAERGFHILNSARRIAGDIHRGIRAFIIVRNGNHPVQAHGGVICAFLAGQHIDHAHAIELQHSLRRNAGGKRVRIRADRNGNIQAEIPFKRVHRNTERDI